MTWYKTAAVIAAFAAIPVAGAVVGKKLVDTGAISWFAGADSVERAMDEKRLALGDLDENGQRELVYFPRKGPPVIYTNTSGSYEAANPVSTDLYNRAVRLGVILASDYSRFTKRALLAELANDTHPQMRPLIPYTALQDPSFVVMKDNNLFSAHAATPLLADFFQTSCAADLVTLDPRKIAAETLVEFGVRFVSGLNCAYAGPPSYASWSANGWTVDANNMVNVAPGVSVHISDEATLKIYRDWSEDPRMTVSGAGVVQYEYPPGMSSRNNYYSLLDRQALAAQQQRQFDRAVTNAVGQGVAYTQMFTSRAQADFNRGAAQFQQNWESGAQQMQTSINNAGAAVNSFIQGLQQR